MAEGDGAIYNNFKEQVMEAEFDLATASDVVKVMLVNTYAPNIDTHTTKAEVDAASTELTGTGYTAGGKALSNQDVTQDDANDRGVFDADDLTWTGLDAGTPSHGVMYDDTHAQKLVIAYWEVTTASNGGNYTLQWGTNGIILLT